MTFSTTCTCTVLSAHSIIHAVVHTGASRIIHLYIPVDLRMLTYYVYVRMTLRQPSGSNVLTYDTYIRTSCSVGRWPSRNCRLLGLSQNDCDGFACPCRQAIPVGMVDGNWFGRSCKKRSRQIPVFAMVHNHPTSADGECQS